jgi:outer membrane protein assembly factor BamA
MMLLRVWFVSACVVTAASVAAAQPTPPAESEQQRKTSTAEPPEESLTFVDEARQWGAEKKIAERLQGTIDGWYPRIGGIRRGSGAAGGAGYRMHAGSVFIDFSAAISVRNYRAFDTHVRWLESSNHRAQLWTDYAFDDLPQERYFGIGLDTTDAGRTSYGLRNNTVTLRGAWFLASRLQLTTSIGYMHPHLRRGNDEEHPAVLDVLNEVQAPSLTSQPAFVQTQVSADLDLRDAPAFARSGGVYHLGVGRWNAVDRSQYDFTRVDATAAQYVPVTADKRHVIVGRVGLTAAAADAGARVPFYFMPYVGGRDTIRSFVEYRFSGENAMWYGAEYMWNMRKFVSVAAFTDRGRVSRTWDSVWSAEGKSGYGFSVIGHTQKQSLARLDVAFGGGEGWQFWLDIGAF